MKGKASVKVPDGKLVKVKTEYDGKFTDVKIRGDFFIEPPEALHDIEDKIIGLNADTGKEDIVEVVKKVEAELIGFSPEDVAEAVKQSTGESK